MMRVSHFDVGVEHGLVHYWYRMDWMARTGVMVIYTKGGVGGYCT